MRILFACNDLDYFIAHRKFLAESLKSCGHDVSIAVEETADETKLPDYRIIRLKLNRYRFSPLSDIKLLLGYFRAIRTLKPDIVHAITIKPILFLSIVSYFLPTKLRPKLVLTFPGLGKIFEQETGFYHSLRRSIVVTVLKFCQSSNNAFATFENSENQATLIEYGVFRTAQTSVILGAGIGNEYMANRTKNDRPVILCAGRLLNAKGVGLFIEAAQSLKKNGFNADFLLAGEMDKSNPDSFDMNAIELAVQSGAINFLGNIPADQMPAILQRTDILCMPSLLKEGLPRIVIEAAACGCALLVSDQGSVKPFVKNGVTGYRLSPVTAKEISKRLELMTENEAALEQMGLEAAKRIDELPVREYQVFKEFQDIYSNEQAAN